ncbi:hypothetical protein FQ377_02600 [Arthrobacter echini]|uniref:Amphi-Trp domain-containing protein n=1 Tax=Arthrobacter echini TaxID=1529066 RepID=A0A5D0XUW7_9MICC|nr:hypothetical protein [Arthrobacter echini]TYD00361.1 hypothetical protein FQ377_02600 [Arthrobacter echini]
MTDKKFTVTEESTSRHPQDWGRAMAVAICRLTDLARQAGDPVHDEALVGEELHLNVTGTDDGVSITMSWTPREQEELTVAADAGEDSAPPDDDSHSAAGQGFDPTGGSTAGVGQ